LAIVALRGVLAVSCSSSVKLLPMSRVVLIANRAKAQVAEALKTFRPWLAQRAKIVADVDSYDGAAITRDADFALVLGGDGTMLAMARRIAHLDLPMVGVNFGKLGFLAPFLLDEVQQKWDALAAGHMPISPRVMLEAIVEDGGRPQRQTVAMNDFVITAGPPFRMVDLELTINPDTHSHGTPFTGDGVIVATPTGSTAYNVSAGGPILSPGVDGLVVTPICPHTLSFRPIVLSGDDRIMLKLVRANAGTTLVIDGQVSEPLHEGATIHLRAAAQRLKLVTNPDAGYWKTLAKKMHWAARPRV
jgi:NAD+ kinase